MSVRDDLKRKYGGGAVTKFPTATSAATAAAAGRTEQKPTGPSPVRQDAAPRENYSIKPGSVAASLREKYGNDTSAASVERYRERMRRTAQQGLERFRADQKNRETAFSPLAVMDATNPNMDPTARAMWGLAEHYRQDTSWQEPGDDWDEDHLLRFGVLYNSDPKEAASYANQVNNYLNAMKRQSQEQAAAADATKNLGSMLAGTAKSILTAPAGFADFLDNLAELGGRGTTTEKDTLSLYDMGQAASGGITRKLNEKGVLPESIPVIGGKGWGDVYGLGTSALQSMALGNTLGKFGTLTTFLGSAAASAVNEKQAQGEYGPRAVAYGAAAGISEVLSEYIPLGDLLEAGPASGVKDLMKNIIKQGLEETIGEGANSIAAAFADWAIMGDKSEYARLIQEGLNAGLDEKAAQKLALRQIAEDVAFDAVGGFATGGMSMGVQQGIGIRFSADQGC